MNTNKLSIEKHNGKVWYLRWYDSKTKATKYKSLKTTSKKEAELKLIHESSKQHGYDWSNSPTFEKAYNAFIDDTERTKGNEKTWINYQSQLKPLLDFANQKGLEVITDLKPDLANEFLCNYKKLKSNSKAQKLKVCKLFFKWAFTTYKLKEENPFSTIKYPKINKTEKSFWTPEQVDSIIDKISDHDFRFCCSIMAYAGFRFFEAQNISFEDLEDDFIKVIGKGGKFAKIPISYKLNNEIKVFLKGKEKPVNGNVFNKEIITNTNTNRIIKKSCILAGIEGKSNCHKFRHSFASNLLRSGASVISTQRLLRHSTPMITLSVYSHVLKEDLIKEINII